MGAVVGPPTKQSSRRMQAAIKSSSSLARGRAFHAGNALRSKFVIPGDAANIAHAEHATADWKKYSKMFAAGVGGVAILEFFVHLSHGHHEDNTLYPFRRIRNKPFPWGDGQTSLWGCCIDKAE